MTTDIADPIIRVTGLQKQFEIGRASCRERVL